MKIKIYTTKYCGFCLRAKELLSKNSLDYEEIPLDDDPAQRQRLADENNGYRTVPMIFIDDTFIGGFTELAQLNQQGKI